MENEKEVEVITTETDNNEDETATVDTETESDSKPEVKENKQSETLEAKRARLSRQLKQIDKKLGVNTESKDTTSHSNSNDLGEKAYLIANGIKGSDEIAFVQKMKKETGKDVESLLETTYFQAEFKEFKEKKATANATPTGSKRSNNTSVDTVEYWLIKGELPPASEVELRRKVVNARMKREEAKGVFYNS